MKHLVLSRKKTNEIKPDEWIYMSATPLQTLVDTVKQLFLDAKAANKVTITQVVVITTTLVKQVCAFEALSEKEKKAIVLLALQQGLAAAGPLQGLSHVDPKLVSELENQALHLAVASVFGLLESAPELFAKIRSGLSLLRQFLSKYLPACSEAAAAASVLDPKDSALIAQAVEALDKVAGTSLQVRTVEPTQAAQNAAPTDLSGSAVVTPDTPPQKKSDTAPNLVASHPDPRL